MDWLRLPPLNSLRAFSVVAETGSYTLAADRLNVTHAAVSQQVKALENRLGVALVTRNGRGIQLTNEGALLARDLDIGFATIGRGIERLSEGAENRPVQVTMSPAFAVEWLMPRIMEFQYDNPDITLMLNPTSEVVDLKPGGIDVAIRYRDRRRPPPNVKPVLISDMIVIGTPSLVGGRDLQDPASLTDLPWLQELGTNEAAEWFTYHGVVPDRPLTVNHMPGNLIMDAVRRGDGITYTARAFFRDDLEVGKVVELFSEPLFGVYFVETLPRPMRPAVRTFLDWLMSKAETVSA
jgi:LysR family glycine cleavage system transcriptional activator